MKGFYLSFLFLIIGTILCRGAARVIPDRLQPYIVGVGEAKPYSWPSQVFIEMNYAQTVEIDGEPHIIPVNYQCGGTLLNKNYIMTAAHCVAKEITVFEFDREWNIIIDPNEYYDTIESMFTVYAGLHNVSDALNSNPVEGMKRFGVKKIIKHPDYNAITQANDIALFEITPEVNETDKIKYAFLPDNSSSIPSKGEEVTVVGWGRTNKTELDSLSDVLKQLDVYVTSIDNCNKFKDIDISEEHQVCAGSIDALSSPCSGDSGGGLYLFDEFVAKYMVVGVVSFSEGCGLHGMPTIYTRVSAYIGWIENIINKSKDPKKQNK